MKETKPEIYKIFKKSLNEPFFNCNKRLLSVKIDTAVKKSAIYLLHTLKEGNIPELQKEYTLLKADFHNTNILYIIGNCIADIIISTVIAFFSSFTSAIYIIVPVLLDIIKDFYVKAIAEPNLTFSFDFDGKTKIICVLLGISAFTTIVKVILKTLNSESSTILECFDKKMFDTTYRNKYIKILSQMLSNPNKFESMNYFEFTKWTRCIIFNFDEPES